MTEQKAPVVSCVYNNNKWHTNTIHDVCPPQAIDTLNLKSQAQLHNQMQWMK